MGVAGPRGHKGDTGEPGPPGLVPASAIALMKVIKTDKSSLLPTILKSSYTIFDPMVVCKVKNVLNYELNEIHLV